MLGQRFCINSNRSRFHYVWSNCIPHSCQKLRCVEKSNFLHSSNFQRVAKISKFFLFHFNFMYESRMHIPRLLRIIKLSTPHESKFRRIILSPRSREGDYFLLSIFFIVIYGERLRIANRFFHREPTSFPSECLQSIAKVCRVATW